MWQFFTVHQYSKHPLKICQGPEDTPRPYVPDQDTACPLPCTCPRTPFAAPGAISPTSVRPQQGRSQALSSSHLLLFLSVASGCTLALVHYLPCQGLLKDPIMSPMVLCAMHDTRPGSALAPQPQGSLQPALFLGIIVKYTRYIKFMHFLIWSYN